jgi:hypothetical protein
MDQRRHAVDDTEETIGPLAPRTRALDVDRG